MPYYGKEMENFKFVRIPVADEKKLFERFYRFKGTYSAGAPTQPWEADALAARDSIIQLYLLLVVKISVACARGIIDEDIAVSAGNLGLMKALEGRKFDPARGFRFSSYLRSYVRSEVTEAISSYINNEGRRKSEEEADGSMAASSEDLSFVDTSAEDNQLNHRRREKIVKAMEWMTPIEKAAVIGVGMHGKTFKEVGDAIGKSRQAVQQAYARTFPKLRHMFSFPQNQELKP